MIFWFIYVLVLVIAIYSIKDVRDKKLKHFLYLMAFFWPVEFIGFLLYLLWKKIWKAR